jgi:hypothetical protein
MIEPAAGCRLGGSDSAAPGAGGVSGLTSSPGPFPLGGTEATTLIPATNSPARADGRLSKDSDEG